MQDRLDKAIADSRPDLDPVADFAAWQRSHPAAIQVLQAGRLSQRVISGRRLLVAAALVGLAFAAGLVLGQVIAARQRPAIEAAVAGRIMDQLDHKIQAYAQKYAASAVVACGAHTQRQLTDLANRLNAVIWLDRQQIASAIRQIELNQIQRMNYLGTSLYALSTVACATEDATESQ